MCDSLSDMDKDFTQGKVVEVLDLIKFEWCRFEEELGDEKVSK